MAFDGETTPNIPAADLKHVSEITDYTSKRFRRVLTRGLSHYVLHWGWAQLPDELKNTIREVSHRAYPERDELHPQAVAYEYGVTVGYNLSLQILREQEHAAALQYFQETVQRAMTALTWVGPDDPYDYRDFMRMHGQKTGNRIVNGLGTRHFTMIEGDPKDTVDRNKVLWNSAGYVVAAAETAMLRDVIRFHATPDADGRELIERAASRLSAPEELTTADIPWL